MVGMMGTLQALETIKLLSGMATPRNTLRLFDARTSNWRALALQRPQGVARRRHAAEQLNCLQRLQGAHHADHRADDPRGAAVALRFIAFRPQAAAQTRLSQLNPQIKLVALQQRLSGEALRAEVAKADVVLDCTDNMVTRQAMGGVSTIS